MSLIFQFAKRYLLREDLCDVDPEVHGPAIAADISDCSSLSTECIKCGMSCGETEDSVQEPFRICEGVCNPSRYFHTRCLSVLARSAENFKCQHCDPSMREEYCFRCGEKPDDTIINCKDMCESFVHRRCLPKGMATYRCGICML